MAGGALRLSISGATEGSRPPPIRRLSGWLYRRRGARLGLLLGPPMLWMLVVYLGALALLLATAFWRQDPLTSEVVRAFTLENFKTIATEGFYRTIALRTLGLALATMLTTIALAFPVAYYAARIAGPRTRTLLLLAVVLPLWSSYLVRVYAWRVILSGEGLLNWSLDRLHLGSLRIGFTGWALWIVFTYLWLPYVALPIYASIERIPPSYFEASGDLGARWGTTFRRVILPLALPGIVAGSIFSFSLTLGDYIAPQLVANKPFIGNIVYQDVGVANNLPLAAAYALVPIVIVALYLMAARRTGAFEAL
jgi:putative spermidine/putrescine transport system permease protein